LAYAADRELHPATNLGSGVSLAREAQQHAIRSVIVDADTVHDRGASDVQELAWALAQGVEALRIYAGAGFEAAEAARQIEFRLVATDEQFPTIASSVPPAGCGRGSSNSPARLVSRWRSTR
jgi:methylmalonyl-CoA mutase